MDEDNEDEEMSLGSKLLQMSKVDPTLSRWLNEVNQRRKGNGKTSKLALAGRDRAAWSGPCHGPPDQVDVSEVYSPPRVTTMASKTGLTAGSAMDRRTG